MLDFVALAQECAPTVAHQTMAAVVNVESGYNPYAIGVVGGRLARQPKNVEEAVATAQALEQGGWNFSLGIAQVNRFNLPKFKLSYREAFEPCANLRAGSKILEDCYTRASGKFPDSQSALQAAFSCYYSGNFSRGFRADAPGRPSYVQKVLASAGQPTLAIPVVPPIKGVATPATAGRPASTEEAPVLLRASRPAQPAQAGEGAGEREASAKPTATNPAIVF